MDVEKIIDRMRELDEEKKEYEYKDDNYSQYMYWKIRVKYWIEDLRLGNHYGTQKYSFQGLNHARQCMYEALNALRRA